jgi:hypothetical protein
MNAYYFILTLNIFNVVMLIILPLRKRFILWRHLYRHRDHIQFMEKEKCVFLPTIAEMRSGVQSTNIKYIECRIDISPTDYIAWKVHENGELVKWMDPARRRWINRECVVQFTYKEPTSTDPFFKQYKFLSYNAKKVWTINGLTRWYLQRITNEPFVMAKMAGIPKFDLMDYV